MAKGDDGIDEFDMFWRDVYDGMWEQLGVFLQDIKNIEDEIDGCTHDPEITYVILGVSCILGYSDGWYDLYFGDYAYKLEFLESKGVYDVSGEHERMFEVMMEYGKEMAKKCFEKVII